MLSFFVNLSKKISFVFSKKKSFAFFSKDLKKLTTFKNDNINKAFITLSLKVLGHFFYNLGHFILQFTKNLEKKIVLDKTRRLSPAKVLQQNHSCHVLDGCSTLEPFV